MFKRNSLTLSIFRITSREYLLPESPKVTLEATDMILISLQEHGDLRNLHTANPGSTYHS